MDPFIDPSALDPGHPLTPTKLANLALADSEHRKRLAVLRSLPSKVIVQTTDRCNLDCVMCQIPRPAKRASMSWELFEKVAEQLFPTLIELHPTNVGEPLVWPWFGRMCGLMERYGVLLDLTTNGTLLDRERVALIAPIARDIKVSVDGADAATFESIRRGASFVEVCRGIERLVESLAQVRVRMPVVALQVTLMRRNVEQLPGIVGLAHRLGAQRVKAYHLFSYCSELDRESLVDEQTRWRDILAETLALGMELGIDLQLAEPESRRGDASLTPSTCHLPWHEAWIDHDGAVLPCHSHGGDVAGNIAQQPFFEAWNGPLYRRIRDALAGGEESWRCTGCGMNFRNSSRHAAVPYDWESFLSGSNEDAIAAPVRWSGRMRPFGLEGRGRLPR